MDSKYLRLLFATAALAAVLDFLFRYGKPIMAVLTGLLDLWAAVPNGVSTLILLALTGLFFWLGRRCERQKNEDIAVYKSLADIYFKAYFKLMKRMYPDAG